MKAQTEHRETNEKRLRKHRGIKLHAMTEKGTVVEGSGED